MSWADCGEDSKGRPIGYGHDAICDHPGCNREIDRGLNYACGGMHGETEISCERYFCEDHKDHYVVDGDYTVGVCVFCAVDLMRTGEWIENEDGDIVRGQP